MLKKILIVITFAFSGYCLANNDCEIKPVLKTYKTTEITNSIKNVISKGEKESILIDVPKPNAIRPVLSIYIYNENPLKAILFTRDYNNIAGYSPKHLNLKAFGVEPVSPNESDIIDYRKGWINCNNLPIKIELNSKEYNVFFIGYPDIINKYSLFIISTDKKYKAIYRVQFTGFSIDEVNNILGTLRIIGDK